MRSAPRGVWAVASGLASTAAANSWARGAERAHAWSFRRPEVAERDAVALLRQLRAAAPWLAVHARLDWALAAGADAVIGGARSLPWPALGELSRARGLAFGCSTHDAEELRAARAAGAGFALFGPVWATPEKQGVLAPRGAAALEEACRGGLPIVAIGGIARPEQVAECAAAGAIGVAVLRAARDPRNLRALVDAWPDSAGRSGRPV